MVSTFSVWEMLNLRYRFIESLAAKVHSTPPSIERLSDIFQDFYVQASSHISTHIQALSTRQSRETSPTPSLFSKPSNTIKDSKRTRSMSFKDSAEASERPAPEQQMLTPQEILDRRKARRLLEQKGVALEEAVEKTICERVYNRIWRHKSTLDEVRDEKLRSRTAALALVGIGLQDLGIELNQPAINSEDAASKTQPRIEEWISKAREGLLKMNEVKNPKAKLEHLAATHKNIVDLLTKFHHSSSSADEILPTLIYTLITTPPEGINVISNLHFTQRFRAIDKIDGEAAYCLTNLEAAITFLETVDLASLRSDEPLEGPPKSSSRPSTPKDDYHPEWANGLSQASPGTSGVFITPATLTLPQSNSVTISAPLVSPQSAKPSQPKSPSNPRRSSNLFQPQIDAIEAASDAVRTSADQGLKNIGNSLDNSFRFLFGRLKEQHLKSKDVDSKNRVILPRTLDDARKLINPKTSADEEGDASGASSVAEHTEPQTDPHMKVEDRILGLFGGQRDRSADSVQSSGSGKRVAFVAEAHKTREKAGSPSILTPPLASSTQPDPTHTSNAAVESMRNLGNTLNPLNRLAGMNVMRGFGRSSSTTTSPVTSASSEMEKPFLNLPDGVGKPKLGAAVGSEHQRLSPPVQRFIEMNDASEMKIGEVEELLKDYKRLVDALTRSKAF